MDIKRLEKVIIVNNISQRKVFFKWAFGLFIFAIFVFIVFPFSFRYYIESQYSKYIISGEESIIPSKIVVLGAGYEIVKSRIEKAAEIYKKNSSSVVILSGADIPEENYFETSFMMDLAIENGIDRAKIQVDDNSSRTFETCFQLKNLNDGETSYLMITQKFHLLRTLFVCREMGVNAFGVIANEDAKGLVETIRTSDDDTLQSIVRETYALTYAIWDVLHFNLVQKNL